MYWIPIIVLKRLKNIYVDSLINRVDSNLNAQAKAQTTKASVIMVVNAIILAIPGLGTQVATKTLCSIPSFSASLHHRVHNDTMHWAHIEIAWFRGVLLTREDGHSCNPCKNTEFSVSDEETKPLIAIIYYSQDHCDCSLAFLILGYLHNWFRTTLTCKDRVWGGLNCWGVIPLIIASFSPGLIQQ